MSIVPGARCRLVLAALLAAALVAPAAAIPRLPKTLYVGIGNNCDFPTIQDAVDGAINGDLISISTTQQYGGQHVTLTNKSIGITGGSTCGLVVIGGPSAPAAATAAAQLPIGGDGANPVFYVNGGTVSISNLDISGGLGAPNSLIGGGGIGFFAGGGTLTLKNVTLHDNTGGYGGGVAVYGDGGLTLDGVSIHDNHATGEGGGVSAVSAFVGHIELIVADDAQLPTEIRNNDAHNNGGGIYAGGNVHLQLVSTAPGRISVHNNLAGDPVHNVIADGGGIFFSGAVADIALPGATGLFANQASFGAGIAIGATNVNSAVVRVFSTDPQLPTDIESNPASAYGGALYVGGNGGGPTYASACLFDAALTGNSAAQAGSAIAIGDGGRLAINPDGDADCNRAAIAALGAVACDPAAAACNSVRQNSGVQSAAIDYAGAATIDARRVRLTGNSGTSAIRGQSASGNGVAFRQCLVDGNTVSAQLVAADGGVPTFDACTFANDSIAGATVFAQAAGLTLTNSIVAEAKPVYDANVAGFVALYALFNDPKLPTDSTVVYASPNFVNAAGGDYHLMPPTAAIDFAPGGSGTYDFDRQPRVVDLDGVTNLFGPRDLGPFEYQVGGVGDRIFLGTFD